MSSRWFCAWCCGLAFVVCSAACSNDIANCPKGTVKSDGECVETRDGGDNGGDANGDSNGLSNGVSEAGVDSGLTDSGMSMIDSGIKPCVPSVPATEVCNGVDDDCNGKVDEGLLVASAASTKEWDVAAPMSSDTQRGFSSLLPRAAGGAWLLYKVTAPDPTQGTEAGDSELIALRLGANNAQVGTKQAGLIPESRSYLATSYGAYVAVIYHAPDADGDPLASSTDDNGSTKLVLWKEDNTGALVQQGDIVTVVAKHTDMSGISLSEAASGELRILVAYSDASDNIETGTGVLAPFVHAYGLNATSGQLYSVTAATELTDAGATVRIVRRPCGPGWIIGYFDPPTNKPGTTLADRQVYLRGVSIDGALGTQRLWASGLGFSFQGLSVLETCEANAARILVNMGNTDSKLVAHELSWSSAQAAVGSQGTVTPLANMILEGVVTGQPAQILRRGGIWYVIHRGTGEVPTGVLELDVPAGTLRTIDLPVALPAMGDPPVKVEVGYASAKHVRDINMYFCPVAGLSNVDNGVLVTFSNSIREPTTGGLLGPETAAMTYKLACSP